MSSLQVTISERLADALLELASDAVEASEGIDQDIDDDLLRFSESVRRAKQRNRRRDILRRVRDKVQA